MRLEGHDGRTIEGFEGKLRVLASNISRESELSRRGDAFFVSTVDQASSLTATIAREVLMLLRNDEPDHDLIIEKFIVTASANDGVFILHKNPTRATLGANIAGQTHNLNFGQSKAPDWDIQIWDETAGGITGVTVVEDVASYIVFQGVHPLPVDGTIIIPPGRELGIDYEGVAGEISVVVRAFRVPSGALLPI